MLGKGPETLIHTYCKSKVRRERSFQLRNPKRGGAAQRLGVMMRHASSCDVDTWTGVILLEELQHDVLPTVDVSKCFLVKS